MLFVNIEKIISARPTKRACILQRQVLKVPTFIWKATPTFWFKLGKSLSKTNKGGKGGRVIPGLLQQSLGEILLPGRKGWRATRTHMMISKNLRNTLVFLMTSFQLQISPELDDVS